MIFLNIHSAQRLTMNIIQVDWALNAKYVSLVKNAKTLMLSINLREPLHTAARNSPGRPGYPVKMSITKYGISCRDEVKGINAR